MYNNEYLNEKLYLLKNFDTLNNSSYYSYYVRSYLKVFFSFWKHTSISNTPTLSFNIYIICICLY